MVSSFITLVVKKFITLVSFFITLVVDFYYISG